MARSALTTSKLQLLRQATFKDAKRMDAAGRVTKTNDSASSLQRSYYCTKQWVGAGAPTNQSCVVVVEAEAEAKQECDKGINASWWVPHPRTGIYYPKGHEKVMDDIPDRASTSGATYWLRGLEGTDNQHNDSSLDGSQYYTHHNTL